jgi:hypothetical protein
MIQATCAASGLLRCMSSAGIKAGDVEAQLEGPTTSVWMPQPTSKFKVKDKDGRRSSCHPLFMAKLNPLLRGAHGRQIPLVPKLPRDVLQLHAVAPPAT